MMSSAIFIHSPVFFFIICAMCMILTSRYATISFVFMRDNLFYLTSNYSNATTGYQSFRNNICSNDHSGHCNRNKASLNFPFLNHSKLDAFDFAKGV